MQSYCQWSCQEKQERGDGPHLVGKQQVQRPWAGIGIGMLEQQPRAQSSLYEGRDVGGGE